ncbi:GlxA family transcriptional regulator [Mesorhizobium sp.]|uniref:GlxA family transcriptional regulator n=1 Tax=Mesorhizobium sp. TaxID=1871066 RepID=UPI003BA8A8FF
MSDMIKTRVPVDNPTSQHLGLVLVPGFSYLTMAMAIEPLFVANWISRRKLFDWSTLSSDGLAVTASNGIKTAVDNPLGTEQRFDIVLVLASFDARQATADTRLLQWLRWAERSGAEVGAIETGSEILAAAGMMEDQTAPVHWYNIEGMRERYPRVNVTDTLYSIAGRRPISAGATATLDMMIALIARAAGKQLADEVAHHLLLQKRPANVHQKAADVPWPTAARDPVARARQIMAATIDEPKPCNEIAGMVGVSERHLQRLFRQKLGASMAHIHHMLRMERAHQLVQLTDLTITEIAVACGFASLEVFSRAYKRAFNISPSLDRRQSVDSSVFRLSVSADSAPT